MPPLPAPRLSGDNKESQQEFVHRCLKSDVIHKEFPDNRQATAVCFNLYKQALKKKRAKGSDEEPTWEEIQAEIEQSGTIQCDGTLKIINLPKI